MSDWEEMAAQHALHCEWEALVSQWICVPRHSLHKLWAAIACPGCCEWQVEGSIGPTDDGGWVWYWDDEAEMLVEEMQDHLATCESGAVMTALGGGTVAL